MPPHTPRETFQIRKAKYLIAKGFIDNKKPIAMFHDVV